MQHGFISRYDYVTVAVNFDHHTLALVRAGAALCMRTGKKLCLMHEVEQWAQLPASKPLGERSPLWDTTQAVETSVREKATQRLNDLALEVPPTIQTRAVTFCAKNGRGLADEAQSIGSCILLVGLDFDRARYFPGAMSTALGLLQNAPIPVLVIDGNLHPEVAASSLDIMLADDLRSDTEPAVAFAFELAGEVHGDATTAPGAMTHLHVSGLTADVMRISLSQAAATAHTQIEALGLAEDIHARVLQGLEQRVSERAAPYREYLENSGGRYTPRVTSGIVEDEVARWSRDLTPDVLVFGRHHAYHSKPFYVGRMSLKAMLGPRRPVVVVPDA